MPPAPSGEVREGASWWLIAAGLLPTLLCPLLGAEGARKEAGDYFQKWLDQDVVYIITDEERRVFQDLSTLEEKENFIEQFWRRRDPDLRTSVNEFKEEHYRRVAYANEHFHSGVPGWKTDRGRIYIIYGPPDEISGKPAGGNYVRPPWEGGGTTSVYPFETWRYRHLEGLGSDVELEFVDPHQSGEFRLARDPQEKDAALHIPNAGLTRAEAMGYSDKRDRIVTRTLADQHLLASSPFHVYRHQDQPFERMLLRAQLERPRAIQYRDLEAVVRTRISYEDLPFRHAIHYLRVNASSVLAPLTIVIPNRELSFQDLAAQGFRAVVHLYGEVWNPGKNMVYNFEDELSVDLTEENREAIPQRSSIFQRYLPLHRGRFLLKLVLKDVVANKLSTLEELIVVPSFPEDAASSSSLILADAIVPEPEGSTPGMFTLGHLRVIPSVDFSFRPEEHIFVYFQLYQLGIDQQTLRPRCRISRGFQPDGQESGLDLQPQFASMADGRVIVVDAVPARLFNQGRHRLIYQIEDLVTAGQLSVSSTEFTVEETDN